MTPAQQELLAQLPGLAFAFTLILCRAGAVVMLVPGIGEAEPPPMLRAGFALALALLLLPVVGPLVPAPPPGWGPAGMVAAELLAGSVLGWIARLPALALSMAGAVISTLTGLTSVIQPDPALGGQSTALTRALGLAIPVIVLSTGLYALPLSALAGSYHAIPPGAVMQADAAEAVQQALAESFSLALRLSAPFLLAGLMLQAGLGLLSRLAPQLQAYAAAMPGQIIGGMALLAAAAPLLLAAWSETVRAAWSLLPGL